MRIKRVYAYGGYNGGGMSGRFDNFQWGTDGTEGADPSTIKKQRERLGYSA